jgi:hypothetical protein
MVSLERLYGDAILLGTGRRGHDRGCRGKIERRWAVAEDTGVGTTATGADADGDGGGRGSGRWRWTAHGSGEGSKCGRRWPMAGVEVGAAVEAEVGGGSLERMG